MTFVHTWLSLIKREGGKMSEFFYKLISWEGALGRLQNHLNAGEKAKRK